MQNKDKIQSKWRGLKGFWQWRRDFLPRILGPKKRYKEWKPTKDQVKYIVQAFQDETQLCLNIQPRRHGKSTVNQMLVLHRICAYQNTTIQLLGVTEDHGRRVMMQPLKNIIKATPRLAKLIPQDKQWNNLIELPWFGNKVQLATGSLGLGAFGDKIDILWISDFHNMADLTAFEAFQGGLLDQEDTLILIDSNVDPIGGHVHMLQQGADNDPTMYCQAVEYADLDDYLKRAPAWINRKTAISNAKNNPLAMKRDLLGQRSNAANALFSSDLIMSSQEPYRLPISDIQEIVKGRKYKIGAGLDRAKKILPGLQGDSTVWTVVLKVAVAGGEPEYWILEQKIPKLNTDKALKKMIQESHKKWHLDSCTIEDYHISADFQEWLTKAGVPFKVVAPTSQVQNAAFPEFFRIVNEGRFKYPKELTRLTKEMESFQVKEGKSGVYTFGHASTRGHDDTVYSTCWGLYGLSRFQLETYELAVLNCQIKSPQRRQCFLLGGAFKVSCSVRCGAVATVQEMYNQHVGITLDDDISLEQFYRDFVKVRSTVIS
jgi:hypothetical protein